MGRGEVGGYRGTNVCPIPSEILSSWRVSVANLSRDFPNRMCVWPRALDGFPALQVRSAEGTRNIRVGSWSREMTQVCRRKNVF